MTILYQFFLGGRGGTAEEAVLPADLLDAILASLNASGILEDSFGQDLPSIIKAWRDKPPSKATFPYVVIRSPEPIGDSDVAYDDLAVQWVRVPFDVFAGEDYATASRLARKVRDHFGRDITDPAVAPDMEWEDGVELQRMPEPGVPEDTPPEWGPNSAIIYGRRVRVRFMIQYHQ
jgi:hypothetical protein